MILSWIKHSLGMKPAYNPGPLGDAVILAARRPVFYTEFGVPDTFDGRFELVALHAQLLFRRLKRDGAEGAATTQAVFDYFTSHFDEALREIGVGDMSVGKRVKTMASGFYGRLSAYEAGWAADDGGVEMAAALRRNLYGTVEEVQEAWIAGIQAYQHSAERHLETLTLAEIRNVENLFAPIGEVTA